MSDDIRILTYDEDDLVDIEEEIDLSDIFDVEETSDSSRKRPSYTTFYRGRAKETGEKETVADAGTTAFWRGRIAVDPRPLSGGYTAVFHKQLMLLLKSSGVIK